MTQQEQSSSAEMSAEKYGALRALQEIVRRSEVEHAGDALYAHAVLEPAKLAIGMLADLLDCMPTANDLAHMMLLLHGDLMIQEDRETLRARRLRESCTRLHAVLHAVRNYHLTMDFDRVTLAEAVLREAIEKSAGVINPSSVKIIRGDSAGYFAIGAMAEIPECDMAIDLRFDLFDEHWEITADHLTTPGESSPLSRVMGKMLGEDDLHSVVAFMLQARRLLQKECLPHMKTKGLRLVQSG